MALQIFSSKINIIYKEEKEMAYVINGQIMLVGELLGWTAQGSKGGQLRFDQVKGSYPLVFEAKGTDNNIYSFEMTSM
ncbi:MAG TPA: hypothetical protein VJ250_06700, partial [Nitrososphaeraceae archaeon]|nr:hypothetical protein [Nitrososphaeraceae archaeon]